MAGDASQLDLVSVGHMHFAQLGGIELLVAAAGCWTCAQLSCNSDSCLALSDLDPVGCALYCASAAVQGAVEKLRCCHIAGLLVNRGPQH